jgi:sarcosine oxidase
MTPSYDVIVIGTGGMGSAACLHAARKGARVLGLEQFQIAHDRGSSHGETRIVRRAYFEHADYVPLLKRAFELWDELEHDSHEPIIVRNGMVVFGDPEKSLACSGSIAAAKEHGIPIQIWEPEEARRKIPIYRPPAGFIGVFEPGAGFVHVERAVAAHARLAREAGAEIREGEGVLGWKREGSGYEVKTDRGRYAAAKLVVTGGSWSSRLLAELGLPLRLRRMIPCWFGASEEHSLEFDVPCFAFDLDEDFYYGFPMLDGRTVKIAPHRVGEAISDPSEKDVKEVPEGELKALRSFISRMLPRMTTELDRFSPCIYTLTPDEHFILDRHPGEEGVHFFAGSSGHGFKFTPVVGEILAELALEGKTRHPAAFLGLSRLGK